MACDCVCLVVVYIMLALLLCLVFCCWFGLGFSFLGCGVYCYLFGLGLFVCWVVFFRGVGFFALRWFRVMCGVLVLGFVVFC